MEIGMEYSSKICFLIGKRNALMGFTIEIFVLWTMECSLGFLPLV